MRALAAGSCFHQNLMVRGFGDEWSFVDPLHSVGHPARTLSGCCPRSSQLGRVSLRRIHPWKQEPESWNIEDMTRVVHGSFLPTIGGKTFEIIANV